MKKVVILTGAGISAESGLKTFRDSEGLWNRYNLNEVATIGAWKRNKQLVLDFYNFRRTELENTKPNPGHLALVELEPYFDVQIITQNVDDLHERAGSSHILHLHGELTKARGEHTLNSVIEIGYKNINIGDIHPKNGEQLRPHIVWFGEEVLTIPVAQEICKTANIFLIIGTSMQVYPASGLIHSLPRYSKIYLIDPKADEVRVSKKVNVIKEKAGTAVPALVKKLNNEAI